MWTGLTPWIITRKIKLFIYGSAYEVLVQSMQIGDSNNDPSRLCLTNFWLGPVQEQTLGKMHSTHISGLFQPIKRGFNGSFS